MDTQNTQHRRRRTIAARVAALATLGLSLTILVTPALAAHTGPLVAPVAVEGQNDCGDLGDWDFEFKIDLGEPNGTFNENSPGVIVSSPTDFEVTVASDGDELSWESNLAVDAVFVKGGPHGNLYDYSSLGFGVLHDNGLLTPDGEAVSHVSFCFDEEPDETPSPTPEETPAETPGETPGETPAETPEGSVAGGTGTPAPSQPDTAMGVQGGPSPIPTIAFALILVAALGTLAWANIKTARSRA